MSDRKFYHAEEIGRHVRGAVGAGYFYVGPARRDEIEQRPEALLARPQRRLGAPEMIDPDRERQLLAEKASRQQEWATAQLDLPSLAEGLQRLSGEVERLRRLLRQQGIEPKDGAA